MKLKEIATVRTGLVLSRKKAAFHDDVKHFYRQITLKSFSDSITLQSQYFDDFISTEEINDTYISQAGDILVRLREPNTAVYIDEDYAGFVVPSLMVIIRVDDERVDNAFLAHYLNSRVVRRILEREVKGTTIPMIKTRDLEDLDIVLPLLQEQKKAVAFMKLAAKELQLLEKLKEEKKCYSQAVLETIIEQNKEEK